MASDMQEKEVGDGTNFVLIFGGQLLQNAAELLNMVILKLTITIINTKLIFWKILYFDKS